MHSGRYKNLIDPQNATLRKLVIEGLGLDCSAISRRQCLEQHLGYLQGFKYINASGLTSLDETIASRSGNCLSLICLLCSLLRSAGFSHNEAFAAVGCVKGFHLIRMHAYALIKGVDCGRLLLIDPEGMRVKSIDYDDLSSSYSLFVIFNDQQQASDNQEMRNLLTSLSQAPEADQAGL